MRRPLLSFALLLLYLPTWSQGTSQQAHEGGTYTDNWQAGQHYTVLSSPAPIHSAVGKVEVVEFFGYKCPHCDALEPYLAQWKKPKYIEFVRVAVGWKANWLAYARLYYSLQALGREDLHQEVFDTVHRLKKQLATKDPDESYRLQLDFATLHGIKAEDFTRVYYSEAVNTQLRRSEEVIARYKIDKTPSIVVAGKYVSYVDLAGGKQQLIELVEYLAAVEHGRAAKTQ